MFLRHYLIIREKKKNDLLMSANVGRVMRLKSLDFHVIKIPL